MAYNTMNPVGSTDARDLLDNATNLDTAVNSPAARWTDRLGVSRPSWAGMVAYADRGAYAAGIEITGYNEIFLFDGEYYRAAASTSLPYTTTGSWSDDGNYFVSIGDAALRADLLSSADDVIGPFNGMINVLYFGSLEEARTNSEAVGKTIVVTTELNEAQSNITAAWPADRALKFEKGGSIANTTAFVFASPQDVHPEWWGLTDTNGSDVISKAAASLATAGGNVILTGTYNLYSGSIDIPANVNLIGQGGKMYRYVQYDAGDATTANMFVLNGRNNISGIDYNGRGWEADVYPGTSSEDYSYYQDFSYGNNAAGVVSNSIFVDSPGSFFTPGGEDLKFIGNRFQDWRDHALYLANSGTVTRRYGYNVTGNTFISLRAETTRDTVKFKGNLGGVVVADNVFNLPNLLLSMINVSAVYTTESFGDIAISGNSGYAPLGYALWAYTHVSSDSPPSSDVRTIENIVMTGNKFHSEYGVWLGERPLSQTAGDQKGVRAGNVNITGNTFTGANGWIINGQDGTGHNGIEVLSVKNNIIERTSAAVGIYLLGNMQAEFDNNTIIGVGADVNGLSFGNPTIATYHWHTATVNTAFAGSVSVTNNILRNIAYLVDDQNGDASNPSACNLDVFMEGNQFVGTNYTPSARRFASSNATYPPTGTLTIGLNNTLAPKTGGGNSYPFYWSGPKKARLDNASADNGDAAKTLYSGVSDITQIWATPLTTARAVALDTTAPYNGATFTIVRTAASTGVSALNVGTGPLKALAAGQWCKVTHNGTEWVLTGFGSL